MEIVFLIVGVAIGAALAFFFVKSKGDNGLGAQLSAATEKGRLLESNVAELKNELRLANESSEIKLNSEKNTIAKLNGELAAAQTDNNNLHQRLLEQKAEIEDLNKRFTKEFENLANRILDEKSQKFTDQNKNNLDIILNPFKEKLKEFEQKVDHAYKTESNERITLKTEIKNLIDLNKQISTDANNLTNALKGEVKTQGNWGELILEKVLEKSGLRKGAEYSVQQSFTTEEGGRLQPDVVIHLPDSKNLIVDSKVSLVAYEKYYSAALADEQQRFLKEHVNSIRNHVKGLSGKNYQNLYNIGSPDFVLMFIPIEAAFSLAVGNDDTLYNEAFEKNVIIVSTSTLLATLRTINNIWKQDRQNKNVLEIARQSGELYDKFSAVVDDFIKVGEGMAGSKKVYDEAMARLYTGKGNVVARFENLKVLGAKASKAINPKIINRTEDLNQGSIE